MTDERLIIDDRLGSVDQLVCDSSESVILVKKMYYKYFKTHSQTSTFINIFFGFMLAENHK